MDMEVTQKVGAASGGHTATRTNYRCSGLDEMVGQFRNGPLDSHHPELWLDAVSLKVRENGHLVSTVLVVQIGVRGNGEREALGLDLGPSENGASWLAFL